MRKILFFPIAVLFGCFNPDLTAASLICDSSHFCPDGYSCIDGLCKPGTGGFQTGGDGGGIVDMTTTASGCSDAAGSDVSSGTGKPAWACPGTYQSSGDNTKNAARLCASGFDLCAAADTINQNNCNNLGGFFLANVAVHSQGGSGLCGASNGTGGQTAAWAGCGKMVFSVGSAPTCNGFGRAMFDFNGNNLSISSPYQPLTTTTSNQANTNGVLCCKK